MWRRGVELAVVAALLWPGMAMAKSSKKSDAGIWEVGIDSVDAVFADVGRIDSRLNSARKLLKGARGDLNTALGLKSKTTLPKALAELNKRANGKIKVVKKGKTPTLAASDAVPTDVKRGIDAVNGFTGDITQSLADLADASKTAVALTRKAKDLPSAVRKDLAKGSVIDKAIAGPKMLKAVNHNMSITKALPKKTDRVVGRLNNIQSSVVTEFTPAKRSR